jgi:hypothetical protein
MVVDGDSFLGLKRSLSDVLLLIELREVAFVKDSLKRRSSCSAEEIVSDFRRTKIKRFI